VLKAVWKFVVSPAVSFIGLVAGLIIGAAGLLYHPKPALRVETIEDTRVLDVHEPIGNLDITYRGESLKLSNRELRVLLVRISNTGGADIGLDSFDPLAPLGIQIQGGDLLEEPTVLGSSNYLTQSVKLTRSNPHTVVIAPVMMEAGEWIDIKLLIAAKVGEIPKIEAIGKVLGVKSIEAPGERKASTESIWHRVTGADSEWIQLARIPVYGIGSLLLLLLLAAVVAVTMVAIILPISSLIDGFGVRRRKKIVADYGKSRSLQPVDHFVVDSYIRDGGKAVPLLRRYMQQVDEANVSRSQIKAMRELLGRHFEAAEIRRSVHFFRGNAVATPKDAVARGIQSEREGLLELNSDLLGAIDAFEQFLRAIGQPPPDKINRKDAAEYRPVWSEEDGMPGYRLVVPDEDIKALRQSDNLRTEHDVR